MSQSLLLIGIGPVQEFIEQARRTRDVWFGSMILSDLARTIAQSLQTNGCSLIFPHPEALNTTGAEYASIANQLLAIAPHADPTTVITLAHDQFKQHINTLLTETKSFAELSHNVRERVQAQIADLFEFHWAWVALDDLNDYAQQRKKLYTLFNARKNTRTFSAIGWEQTATNLRRSNKSSLDGWRESVMQGEKRGENLSGVDLLKRYALRNQQESSFPSTSHMAALPFGYHLQRHDEHFAVAWQRYINRLDELHPAFTRYEHLPRRFRGSSPFGNYDGSLIYESRLGEDLPLPDRSKATMDTYTAQISQAHGYLSDFFRSQSDASKIPPGYYAILAADGDHMGKLIDAISTVEDHQMISQLVSRFASGVSAIVEKYHGALIYAGGDDVLALLPLHTVVKCASKLATIFNTAFDTTPITTLVKDKPTLSVGVAIVHHLEALQDSLKLARNAEKVAKRSRNALAIILSKRNGGDTTITGQWNSAFITNLKRLIELHHAEHLPDGFIFELREMLKRFDFRLARDDAERTTWRTIIGLETKRIVSRKQTPSGLPMTNDRVQELMTMIHSLNQPPPNQPSPNQPPIEAQIALFVNINIIARELASIKRMVDGPIKKEAA